jgi:hypothetical protein
LAQGGVALALLLASATQGYLLVNHAAVTDDRRFADHHPVAVTNHHANANLRTGVNFGAGQEPPQMRQQPGHQGDLSAIQAVGNSVKAQH